MIEIGLSRKREREREREGERGSVEITAKRSFFSPFGFDCIAIGGGGQTFLLHCNRDRGNWGRETFFFGGGFWQVYNLE